MESLPSPVRLGVVRYRDLLRSEFGARLLWVRVFGSYARGDAGPESDVDVAVVIRGLDERERTVAVDLAWKARCPRGPLLSPIVWTDEQWADRTAHERRIALDIQSEGLAV